MVTLQTQKQQLRKIMQNVLNSLTEEDMEHQSKIIRNYLFEKHEKFLNSKHIAIYITSSKLKEVDTNPIIRKVLCEYKNKMNIYIPHVEPNEDDMKFYNIKDENTYDNDMTNLNKYNLRQFKTTKNLIEVDPNILDLVFVPGLAFSKKPNENKYFRIGRGKGYYDRYLSRIPNCHTIALAFNEQLIPNEHVNLYVPAVKNQDFEVNELLSEKLS